MAAKKKKAVTKKTPAKTTAKKAVKKAASRKAAVKKAPAKKTAAKKTTAKKKAGKPAAAAFSPVKQALTKSALIARLAEENDLTRAQAAGVFASLENVLLGSIHPKGVGSFMLPGLMKVTLQKVPARKAGVMVRNPGTGEMVPAKARPATVRVKVRALQKLKSAATS